MRPAFFIAPCAALSAAVAQAGMPDPDRLTHRVIDTFRLTDAALGQLQAISFFLFVLVLSACIVRLLWNALAREFPALPRMSFWRAVLAVTLWGLLFLVVLTMIATVRETMTPGAWAKQGLLYRLADSPKTAPPGEKP